jgi:hypothetical protein
VWTSPLLVNDPIHISLTTLFSPFIIGSSRIIIPDLSDDLLLRHCPINTSHIGIEWLNDTTLHLIFPSPRDSLLSLSLLSKAGFDPSEGDDPLLERAAHSFPLSLLPTAPISSLAETELLPSTSAEEGGIRRKGRGAFTKGDIGAFDLPPLVPVETSSWNFAEGVDPNARVGVRFGLEGDMELRGAAKASEWYKRHGRHAGKEIAGTRRSGGGEREQVSWGAGRENGEGREFAKRLGRAKEPYARPQRAGKTADDLDRELEGIRSGNTMEVDEAGEERGGGRRGGSGRRQERGKVDLDQGQYTELLDLGCNRS